MLPIARHQVSFTASFMIEVNGTKRVLRLDVKAIVWLARALLQAQASKPQLIYIKVLAFAATARVFATGAIRRCW